MTIVRHRYVRDLDRLPESGASLDPIDVDPALGMWRNTNRKTWGISHAELTRSGDRPLIRVWGRDPEQEWSYDWGVAPLDMVYTNGPQSSRICGYTAAFDFGHARTLIQANMDHGLTVLAAFTTFTDGSGRHSYLAREFYHHLATAGTDSAEPAPVSGDASGNDRLPMLRAEIDQEPLLGRWQNTDPASRGIGAVDCIARSGRLHIRVSGIGPDGPIDWGEVPATVHTDITVTGSGRATVRPATPHYADISAMEAGPAFTATYDHGFMRVRLQARMNLGILVMAAFSEFVDDSGRYNYFNREIFAR